MTDYYWYLLKALLLGLIEGFTEFIPVSSTAHLLLLAEWISFPSDDNKVFEVVIQFGSILAVIWLFRARIIQLITGVFTGDRSEILFMRNLILAFLPAAVIGALTIKYIKMLFHNPLVFVFTLVLGGLIMLWVERKPAYAKHGSNETAVSEKATAYTMEDISWKQALVVGFSQCLAMVPGTSRSGATIVGGMLAGIQRKTATEFSFFLAMPTMLAATVYDLYKNGAALNPDQTWGIVVGFVAAFFSALFLVKAVLRFVSKRTYRPFAWYRIALGAVVLAWLYLR
ncbi:undecaprenyl-diphosphate phosphatase [uncultured Paenalcaligenes sp.]|uniref:undecaprenyl-diphosphate phosphatase n=1 Tax=uncultured Paenalcaligenes sp. TaxID=1588925 RepID=UPI0026121586|nr:undecaprenyl-diphosphate phosphatase [uncultured Paenalcaligenes sp.]